MNLTSKAEIRDLLKKHQIRPSKDLGQNFLINEEAVKRFVRAAEISKKDVILEIGPGLGSLTQELAKSAEKVIAVEKDPKMCEILKETLANFNNIDIIREDIRKINTRHYILGPQSYKVVANLPFYLTAPVIRKFLETENPPKEMILGVQKEVAQRICAKVPDMNLLAVSVQFYAAPKIVSFISKKSFWPEPKVDAAIIKIAPRQPAPHRIYSGAGFRERFFKIVRAGFSQPRKQLINNLSTNLRIEKEKIRGFLLKNGVQPSQRAESLSVKDWINLTNAFKLW